MTASHFLEPASGACTALDLTKSNWLRTVGVGVLPANTNQQQQRYQGFPLALYNLIINQEEIPEVIAGSKRHK